MSESSLNRPTPTVLRRVRTASAILAPVLVNAIDSWAVMNHSSRQEVSQTVTETEIEVPNKGLHKYDKVRPGEQTVTILRGSAGTKGGALAYVHVPWDAPKGDRQTRPRFTVSGPNGEPLSSVRSVGAGMYEVHDGDGTPIGRITRRGGRILPWPRRVHWSVQSTQGGEPHVGAVGTRKAWAVFVLISPLYFVCWAVMAAQGAVWLLLGEKGEAKKEAAWEMEPPTWTRWRSADESGVAIEYRTGRMYRLVPPRLDLRLAYAQAVLHVWDRM